MLQKNTDVGAIIKSWKLTKKFEISKQNSCAIYSQVSSHDSSEDFSYKKKGSTIVGIIDQLHREKKV